MLKLTRTFKHRVKRLTNSVAFWLLCAQLLTAGSAFLLNLLSSASLDPDGRGLLALFLQVGYLSTAIALLGVERPYVAMINAQVPTATNQLHRLALPGLLAFTASILVAGLVLLFHDVRLAFVMFMGCIFVASNVHLRILRSAAISAEAWRGYVTVAISGQLLLIAVGFAMAALRIDDLITWIGAYSLAGMIPTVYLAILARQHDDTEFVGNKAFQRIRREGIRLLPASIGTITMQRADRFLLPVLASPAALGIYVMAATAIAFSVWPIQQWADSKLRHWATQQEQGWRRILRPVVISMAVSLSIGVVMASIVWIAIDLFMSTEYREAKSLLPALVSGYTIYAATRVQQGMLIASGHSKFVTVTEVAGMGASVLACFALIPVYGAMGAAVSVVIGNLVSALLGVYFLARSSRVEGSSQSTV